MIPFTITTTTASSNLRGKRCFAGTLMALYAMSPMAAELPSGSDIASGQASISRNGQEMTVDQASAHLITNWDSFSIGEGGTVTFNQPGTSSKALNRVVGQDPSRILGSLQANGQVFLINPNGIAIGTNGSVQTGGFVTSTLGIEDKDFLNDELHFKGTNGTIVNNGRISSGTVALIAPRVTNNGEIIARAGQGNGQGVALGAGTDVLLDISGDGLLSIKVSDSTLAAMVQNNSLIQANGSRAILTARGASSALKGVVNNTGIIEAQNLTQQDGQVLLLADMGHGEVQAQGSLRAGFVETSAASVRIDDNLMVDTLGGRWLIDPTNIDIDAAMASAIESSLSTGNVTVTTADNGNNSDSGAGTNPANGSDQGNITVNAPIAWSSNVLTLRADNSISINRQLTSSGTTTGDGLILRYAQSNADGNYTINAPVNLAPGSLFQTVDAANAPITYTVISSLGAEGSTSGTDLQGINGNLSGNFALGTDIDASSTSSWNANAGFLALGTSSARFNGRFEGLGHTITQLNINRPGTNSIALFGSTRDAFITNVRLADISIHGNSYVGGVIGSAANTGIHNVSTSGQVQAQSGRAGGLVGYHVNGSHITRSFSASDVYGQSYIGGLVGDNYFASISQSYSTGDVEGTGSVIGGLVGQNRGGTIRNAYTTGAVHGDSTVGGLVGTHYSNAVIENAYAAGPVSGPGWVAGLIAINNPGGVTNTFHDRDRAGASSSCVLNPCSETGLTTAQMQDPFTFIDAGWDFTNDWGQSSTGENSGYMMLRWQSSNLYDTYTRPSPETPSTPTPNDPTPDTAAAPDICLGSGSSGRCFSVPEEPEQTPYQGNIRIALSPIQDGSANPLELLAGNREPGSGVICRKDNCQINDQ